MTIKNLKTALAAVTLAAASLATPLSAHAYDNNRDCADTTNGVIGAVIGGTAGAALGDRVARRGQSTEIGILGAVIGGIAGAAVGDSLNDCENRRGTNQPFRTTNSVYTAPRTVYTAPRTVYTPRVNTSRSVFNTSYGNNRGFDQDRNRVLRIDREIDQLCREINYLQAQRRGSRGRNSNLRSRINQLEQRVDNLKREQRHLRNSNTRSRSGFRSY